MQWLAVAKQLTTYSSTRVACCEKDKSAIINNRASKWTLYCFRCGRTESERKEFYKLTKKEEDTTWLETIQTPKDYTTDLPHSAVLYLRKKGIGNYLQKKYQLGWSEEVRRLIIPVKSLDGELTSVIARDVSGKMEKKVLNSRNRLDAWMYSKRHERTNKIVLVEDFFSAAKVGEVVNCNSMNGTKLQKNKIKELLDYEEVVIWLDPDTAGRSATKQIKNTLQDLVKVTIISTEKDPKLYSEGEIKQVLSLF